MTKRVRYVQMTKPAKVPEGGPTGPEWTAAEVDIATKATKADVDLGGYGIFYVDAFASVQAALTAAGNAGGGIVQGNPATSYAQTTTLSVPAGVTLRSTILTFTGTPDGSAAAVRLDGAGAAIEDCTVAITAGTYYRHIHHRASNTASRRNTLTASGLTQATPTTGLFDYGFYSIFASIGSDLTSIVIEDNDISFSSVNYGDGVQAVDCPGIIVRRNHVHDLVYTWAIHSDKAHFWGIYVSDGCQDALVEGNTVETCDGCGIHFHAGTGNQAIDHGRKMVSNTIRDCAYFGIGLDSCNAPQVIGNHVARCERLIQVGSSGDACWGGVVSGNTLGDVTLVHGSAQLGADIVYMSALFSPSVVITGNAFGDRGSAIYAVYVSGAGSTSASITANIFNAKRPRNVIFGSSSSHDIIVANNIIPVSDDTTAGSAIRLEGNDGIVSDNRVSSTVASNWFGVRLYGSRTKVQGNRVYGGARCVIVSAGTANEITNNTFSDSSFGAIDNSGGTSTVIKRNIGYVTENSGVTSVADGGTIAHGLAATPTKYGATPSTASEFVSITAASSTTLTVAIKKHDNSAGTTQNIAWWAEM